MRKFFIAAAVAVISMIGTGSTARADFVRLDFSSLVGGGITFDPTDVSPPTNGVGTFTFKHGLNDPGTTADESQFAFKVTNSTGDGSALFLLGDITGTYNVGPITTSGSSEVAQVVAGAGTSHQFSITDAGGNVFSADVDWINIRTTGAIGGTNADGQINLSNLAYSGTNADLLAVYNQSVTYGGSAVISFQMASPISLTQLFTTNTGPTTTSFSGSVSATPAPAGLVLALTGMPMLGLGAWVRRRRLATAA